MKNLTARGRSVVGHRVGENKGMGHETVKEKGRRGGQRVRKLSEGNTGRYGGKGKEANSVGKARGRHRWRGGLDRSGNKGTRKKKRKKGKNAREAFRTKD